MFGWLLKNLVQEVPEELSICEFDCPYNQCTVRDWVECDLRHQQSLHGSVMPQYHLARVEVPVYTASGFGKAQLLKPLSGF